MSNKRSILVATIGTRDLAFQVSTGEWRNIGDKQAEGNSKTDRMLVQEDVGKVNTSLREITNFFLESWDEYSDRLQPIIIGQLLQDKSKELEKIYLIGTDQLESVSFRGEDTLYSAKIIQLWIKKYFEVPVEVILQGHEGYNPSNFEEMFQWWKGIWNYITSKLSEDLPVILCLKGGVGQSSEASRITALSQFAENAIFYDFSIDKERNLSGKASLYGNPSLGANYLWDRRQKEALALLKRFDYEAVDSILKPYFSQNLHIEKLLEAAMYWNNSKFQEFADVLGDKAQERSQQWWWTGYEAAYLGVVRLTQENIVEAFFHSFRTFEGIFSKWGDQEFRGHIHKEKGKPMLQPSILTDEKNYFQTAKFKSNGDPKDDLAKLKCKIEKESGILLDLSSLCKLFRNIRKNYETDCKELKMFWKEGLKITDRRNIVFHQLLGMTETQLWEFWEVQGQIEWENQILSFLNFITEQTFDSLGQASLMANIHQDIEKAIAKYQPASI
ncbi:hypothetical protein Syn7502_02843 [Synechococcus sp. PCC 7502]|uniref:hypothetical protein n=1 Tax=Synechococcus sp. PCC 7502 TaxID=1173263 RepID=UPI00029FECEB|nr:hypothetical protein [Synechococcus sp. PCC 7502]AFY74780.1 hypothetical protein Syn7502_02843 [Synechococcus sp. PCC 7502]